MKGFQVGILIFFGLFVFLGVLIFSGAIKLPERGADQTVATGTIKIWGTIPKKQFNSAINYLNGKNPNVILSYVEKDPLTYRTDLLNAFAFGGLPDIFLLSQDLIAAYEDKVITIPFTNFPERTYNDTYVRAAELFKTPEGFLGFPVFSDPLVMYYNQDLLEAAGYVAPPKYWKDLFDYVPKLTVKNDALQVIRSGVALGEFKNVTNAKEIFLAMNLQLGNQVVVRDIEKDSFVSVFDQPSDVSGKPAVQSLEFYNTFSNPVETVYSWNKSKAASEDAFVAGDLAIYFGLASELSDIRAKNPNLNFDVAAIPQVEELPTRTTYADVYALAIPKTSANAQAALSLSAELANGADTLAIVGSSGFAPLRRDLITVPQSGTTNAVFYQAALNARSWFDPNDNETNKLFESMVEDVISGLVNAEDSIERTSLGLRRAFSQ